MKKSLITSLLIFGFGLLVNSINAQSTVYFSSVSGNYSVIEGNTYSFNVNLDSVSLTPVVVDITTISGTAGLSDYTALTTTVTIPAGQLYTSTSLSIPTTNDTTIELNEKFTINGNVTSGNTTNTTFLSQVFIIDNDTVPTVLTSNINNNNALSINEITNATVYYYLSNPYNSNITINCTTTTGTAGSSDFTAVNSTVTFIAGQTQAYKTILITNDAITEPDESFTLTGTITTGNTTNPFVVATITIIDNDTPPSINIENVSFIENDSYPIYIQLNRPFNDNVVIQFNTVNGTAGNTDYTSTNSTITIPAGEIYAQIDIPITNDTLDEPVETFTIVGNVTSGIVTNPSFSSTVSIIDDDGLPDLVINQNNPIFNSTQVEEGQEVSIFIHLTHASPVNTVIQITTPNGTAGNTDYVALSTTLTIPAGQLYLNPQFFSIATLLDQLLEGDETFNVTATVTSGNVYTPSVSSSITIVDNYSINANGDTFLPMVEVGGTFQVLTNDTFEGLPVNFSSITLSLASNSIGATLNSQGFLTVPSAAPIGYYTLSYTICEIANPSSCSTATIIIQVVSPLMATYTASYSDFNGDGYTSVGDVINYQFNITNNGNAPITNINFDYFYGIIPNGGPIPTLNAGQTDSTTFSGIHILTQNEINFGYNFIQQEISFNGIYYGAEVTDFAEQIGSFSLPIPDAIRLIAFIDTNSNGTQEASEIDFPLGHFNYEINNDGVIHNLYNTPYYLYESNPTTLYNLSYTIDSSYATNNICSVSYSNITIASGSGITTYNFPITVTPYQDLSVNINNYSLPPIPGFLYYNYVSYTNNSNQTVASGTITYTKDNALSIVNVPTSGAIVTPTGFTYNFTNLFPYQTRYIGVVMQVPTIPTVTLGQLVTNSVSINLLAGDILPLNNNSSLTQTIVGSYDPNDKQESHGGRILHSSFTSNDYLNYTIRFENTGTANAINVKLTDDLDAKLDETSIRMIASSHDYTLERIGADLIWKFNGINLPPSVPNSQIGHGFITFQIKPKAGYAVGDVIPNFADIYFDFNPAIVTNTCTTEFVTALGNANFAFTNFNYYPNPVKNTLAISNASTIDNIEITSVLGQQMLSKKVNELQTEINLSELSNGIYFVKVTSEGQEKTVKIIKE